MCAGQLTVIKWVEVVVRACGLTRLHMGDSEFFCHCGFNG